MANRPSLALSVQYAASSPPPARPQVRALAAAALAAAGVSEGEVTVRFVEEEESAALNGRYRGKTRATNVLSFDYREGGSGGIWGDIVICAPVVCREAQRQGKTVDAHCAHLIVHGILHLAGYRHDNAAAAAAMEALEAAVLEKFGIANPYR